jgi:hypothetical protein
VTTRFSVFPLKGAMNTARFGGMKQTVRVAFLAPGQEFRTLITGRRGRVEGEYKGGPGMPVSIDGKKVVVHDGLRVAIEVPEREAIH